MLSIGSKLKELSEHTLIYGIGSAIKSMLLILYGYIIFNKILEDSEKKYLNNFFINKI